MKENEVQILFDKYYNQAKLYTYFLSHSEALADDIAGNAFFKAINTADNVQSFKFWLLKICRNDYYDYLRKAKKQVELKDDFADNSENVLDKLIKEEEYASLYRAIDLLSNSYKEVIMLFYFEGLKIEEIGLLVGKSIENVKVVLFRAREKLKKILKGEK